MASVLQELLVAGLIEKLDGDDGRLRKIEKAVASVAESLKKDRTKLISAILTALDDEASGADPAIQLAEASLTDEWKTVSSIYPDKPIHLYRAMLLAACAAVGQGENAAILWLSAVDTAPFCRLGAETDIVRRILGSFADSAEKHVMSLLLPSIPKKKGTEPSALFKQETQAFKFDREALTPKLAAAVGNINYAHHQPQTVINTFSNQMKTILGDLVDELGTRDLQQQEEFRKSLRDYLTAYAKSVQETLEVSSRLATKEQLKVDALWWYESLYSLSAHKSYREFSPVAASVLMPLDLLSMLPALSPPSVGYVLSEAVARLPGAGFEHTLPLHQIIADVSTARHELSSAQIADFAPAPTIGRLSMRDIVKNSLSGAVDPVDLLRRAKIPHDTKFSLPHFARVILHQEQAVRLATGKK